MPFLKNKLARTIEKEKQASYDQINVKVEHHDQASEFSDQSHTTSDNAPNRSKKSSSTKKTPARLSQERKTANSAKNIVKNFGRAMITFAISKLASPYIEKELKIHNITEKEFTQYLYLRKENMDGISSLRGLLLVEEDDDAKTVSIKKVFQWACEVFIKLFSVNWIFNSKLGDKMVHVKARFKILRRIRDPKNFTYLKF